MLSNTNIENFQAIIYGGIAAYMGGYYIYF